MLLDAYEFLKELNKEIEAAENCRHNITLDKDNNVVITIMSEGLILPATLDYDEIKNGLRSNIIKEIKQHFEIEKEKYYEKNK